MTLPTRTSDRIRKHHDLACWLALLHTRGIGPATFRHLIDSIGAPAAILETARQGKLTGHIRGRTLDSVLSRPDWQAVDRDIAWLEAGHDRHILTWDDDRYPVILKEISDPPPVLFVQGNVSLLSSPQLAIVGSRNPTISGQRLSEDFARQLAVQGLTITSGLALGVDAAAHRGALAATGRTIAVLGCGLDSVYPRRHEALAAEILEQGALVSELPTGAAPLPVHFPRRNRIISGLSVGTLVTEAAIRSGSLITALQALEQGREVFAIPGSIHNPLARGCHQLLRQGAKLVEQLNDIIEEIQPLVISNRGQPEAVPDNVPDNGRVDPAYQIVIKTIGFDPTPIDILAERTGMTVETLSSVLLSLELDGRIACLPGGHYICLGNEELI